MYVLYYSQKCFYCKTLCSQLQSFPDLQRQFRFVDAEKLQNSAGMSVPTILADKQRYVGRDAFSWVRAATAAPAGPQCFDIGEGGSLTFSDIDGPNQGSTYKPRNYCGISDAGVTTL